MPPKGFKGKKGKGKALPPPVLEPPQLEPAQKEVDKTTNVKAKKKKVVTIFDEQVKEKIMSSSGRMRSYIANGLWLQRFQQEICPSRSSRGSNRDHHRSKFPFTNRNLSQQSAWVLYACIRTLLHVPVRNKSFTMIVIIVSDCNGIANSIVTILSERMWS